MRLKKPKAVPAGHIKAAQKFLCFKAHIHAFENFEKDDLKVQYARMPKLYSDFLSRCMLEPGFMPESALWEGWAITLEQMQRFAQSSP